LRSVSAGAGPRVRCGRNPPNLALRYGHPAGLIGARKANGRDGTRTESWFLPPMEPRVGPWRSCPSLTQTCRRRLAARSARWLEGVTLKRCAYHRENTLGAANPNSADTLDMVRTPSAK